MKKILFVIFVLFTNLSYSQEASLLLNLKEGETYFQNYKTNYVVKQRIGNKTYVTNVKINIKLSFYVKSVLDTGYLVEMYFLDNYTSVKTTGNKKGVVKSKEHSKNPANVLFARLRKFPMLIVVTQTGDTYELRGFDQIIDSALNTMEDITDQQRQYYKNTLLNYSQYGYNDMSLIYDTSTVEVGHTWNYEYQVNAGIPLVVDATYTLAKITPKYFIVTDTLEMYSTDEPVKNDYGTIVYDIKGNTIGNIRLDRESGWLTKSVLRQKLQGSYILTTDDGQITVPYEFSSKIIISD